MALEDFAPAIAGAAAALRRRPEIMEAALDAQIRRLIREQELEAQAEALRQSREAFPLTQRQRGAAAGLTEQQLVESRETFPHRLGIAAAGERTAAAEATRAERMATPEGAARFTEEDVRARERGLRTAFGPEGSETLAARLRLDTAAVDRLLDILGTVNPGILLDPYRNLFGTPTDGQYQAAIKEYLRQRREQENREADEAERRAEAQNIANRIATMNVEEMNITQIGRILASNEANAILLLMRLRTEAVADPSKVDQYIASLEAYERIYNRKPPQHLLRTTTPASVPNVSTPKVQVQPPSSLQPGPSATPVQPTPAQPSANVGSPGQPLVQPVPGGVKVGTSIITPTGTVVPAAPPASEAATAPPTAARAQPPAVPTSTQGAMTALEGAAPPTLEYRVKSGDTLNEIAADVLGIPRGEFKREFRRRREEIEAMRDRIAQMNGIQNPNRIRVGTRLRLPVLR